MTLCKIKITISNITPISEKLTVNIFSLNCVKDNETHGMVRENSPRMRVYFNQQQKNKNVQLQDRMSISSLYISGEDKPKWNAVMKRKKVFVVKQYQCSEFGWRSMVWPLWKDKCQHTRKIMNYNNNRNNKCKWSMIVWVSIVVNRNVVDSDWC